MVKVRSCIISLRLQACVIWTFFTEARLTATRVAASGRIRTCMLHLLTQTDRDRRGGFPFKVDSNFGLRLALDPSKTSINRFRELQDMLQTHWRLLQENLGRHAILNHWSFWKLFYLPYIWQMSAWDRDSDLDVQLAQSRKRDLLWRSCGSVV